MDIAALMVAYTLSLFYRTFMAVLAPFLTEDLGVTAAELSDAVGMWFLFFALAQLPTGLLLDRFGPRRAVSGFLLVGAGGGALVLASAQSAFAIQAALAMIGAGCAPLLMAGMFLFARRFEPSRFATMTAVMMGVGGLGNMLSSAPLAWAAGAVGWRTVMVILAAFAAALAGLCWALLRDPPTLNAPVAGQGFWRSMGVGGFWELLKMPVLLAILPLALFNYAVSGGLRGLWSGPYLAEIQGLSAAEIGTATLFMALAMTFGSTCFGPFDRILGTRKWIIAPLNAMGAACIGLLAFTLPGPDMAVALIIACCLFGATYPVLIAHFRSFVPARLTGRGVTLINVFGMIGVSFGQFVTARLSGPLLEAGENATAYHRVFVWYAVTLGVAVAAYILFARDARPEDAAD